jgi:flagellar hook assembly protein FlgD/sugar lactone lactonase YvrE
MNVLRLFLIYATAALTAYGADGDSQALKAKAGTFSFDLPEEGVTSAGVFAKDALIKTLWSNVRHSKGKHNGAWNGDTDDGGRAPFGSYTVKVLSSQVRYTWEGVVGNTSASFSGPTLHHAEDIAYGMAIDGDNIYIAAGYNEGRSATLKTSVTHPDVKSYILPTPAAHGYTDASVRFVVTDGNYVYWAGVEASRAPRNHFIYATRVSDDGEVSFREGKKITFANHIVKQSAIDRLDSLQGYCTGLAVQKDGPWLFATHRELNELHVLDKSTGALVKSISLNEPSALAVDGQGQLWMASVQEGHPVVAKYAVAADGTLKALANLTIAGLNDPLALAVSPDNRTLLLADGGKSQQLRAYDNASGKPLWTYGQEGGYAVSPDVADDKFFFRDIDNISRHVGNFPWSFLAWQPDGSFWVGDSGNFRCQHYSADRKFLRRIMWLPTFYTALVDRNDGERLFADLLEFHVDYSKPLAPDNGSWKLVRNWAGREIPADYYSVLDGVRNGFYPWLTVATLKNGRTYATFRNYKSGKQGIVELDPRTGLRFTGLETSGLNCTLAADGSLHTLTPPKAGQPLTWSLQPLTGFDALGNPQWGPLQTAAVSAPVDRTVLDHAPYISGIPLAWEISSHGIIASFDAQAPLAGYKNAAVSHAGWHLAGLDARTGTWRWKAAPSTLRGYQGDWPANGSFDIGNGVGNAGSYCHVVGDNIFWEYLGEGWKGGDAGEVNMWTHLRDDGLMVGQFGARQNILPDGKEDEGQPGMAGNASSHGIAVRPDGVIYIYHNDEGFHGGVHRWRVDNLSSIREQEIPVTCPASAPVSVPDQGDLLAGLPRDQSVTDGTAGWHRSPAEEVVKDRNQDWWSVRTNVTEYRKEVSPDIDIGFAHRPGSSGTVTRDLPGSAGPVAGWKLTGTLRFAWPNIGKIEGLNVEVLDDAGQVIAQISPTQVSTRDYRFLVNGQPLYTSEDPRAFTRSLHQAMAFTVEVKEGTVTFTGNELPQVSTACLDAASHWRTPKTLRVRAWSTGGGYHHGVNFRALRFEYF